MYATFASATDIDIEADPPIIVDAPRTNEVDAVLALDALSGDGGSPDPVPPPPGPAVSCEQLARLIARTAKRRLRSDTLAESIGLIVPRSPLPEQTLPRRTDRKYAHCAAFRVAPLKALPKRRRQPVGAGERV